MKKHLILILKNCKILFRIYYWFGSIGINILKFFIKPNDKLILFMSFGGKKFDDSPKVIYEQMIKDKRFNNYELVWAFQNKKDFKLSKGRAINTDSLQYYITALKARVWITNSTIERGLNFKGKNTIYINTWHGTPIKKMGSDMNKYNKSFGKGLKLNVDLIVSQSKYEADIFSRVFNINREKFAICGLPRNDILLDRTIETKQKMMKKIGVPLEKKVILYAPTYREYERDKKLNCVLKSPINFSKWKDIIGEEYIILFRPHYEISKIFNIKLNDEFVYDVSKYESLNDLMLASDILISDYSSIFFDYSILDRPMLYYTYDYDEYQCKRGLYFDIRKELYGSSDDEEKLLNLIKGLNYSENLEKVRKFRSKYVESYGNSTEIILNNIFRNLN